MTLSSPKPIRLVCVKREENWHDGGKRPLHHFVLLGTTDSIRIPSDHPYQVGATYELTEVSL